MNFNNTGFLVLSFGVIELGSDTIQQTGFLVLMFGVIEMVSDAVQQYWFLVLISGVINAESPGQLFSKLFSPSRLTPLACDGM